MMAACAMQEQPPRMGQIYGTAKKICEFATIPLSAILIPSGTRHHENSRNPPNCLSSLASRRHSGCIVAGSVPATAASAYHKCQRLLRTKLLPDR